MEQKPDKQEQAWSPPEDWGTDQRIIWDLGFFGHYMHMHHGGRSGQKHVLVRLAKYGGSMSQRELQGTFDVKSGSMSEVLSKLEAEGFIERKKSEEDGRARMVSLTDAGWEATREVEEHRRSFEHQALATLTDQDKEQLLATLDGLIMHWKEMDE